MRFKLFMFLIGITALTNSWAQKADSLASDQAQKLYKAGKYERVITFCKNAQQKQKLNTAKDSLEYGHILYYQGMAHYMLNQFQQSIESYKKAINLAPNNEEGNEQKGVLYNEKSFSESKINRHFASQKSMQQSVEYLANFKKPNLDYLLSGYSELAGTHAQYGYFDKAEMYVKKCISLYNENKRFLDSIKSTKSASRAVYFPYRYAFIIKNKIDTDYNPKDSKKLLKIVEQLDSLKQNRKTKFNARESLIQAATYNLYADHFLTRNYPNTTTQEADSAVFYLNKAIKILDKEAYPDHLLAFQFNTVKAYTAQNKNDKALEVLDRLIQQVDTTSYNYTAFLSFKINLLLKENKLIQATELTDFVIKTIHNAEQKLKEDYSNFVPSEESWTTGLLLDLNDFYEEIPGDDKLKELKTTLSDLAFKQLKHCHRQLNFNERLRGYFLRSINGQLAYLNPNISNNHNTIKQLINDTENIENRLAWQQFNQSRDVVQLPLIDSLEQVEFQLRKQLVAAKKQRQLKQQDSLQDVLSKHNRLLEKNYPKLAQFTQDNFEITEFQRQIQTDEVVLKYLFFEDEFAVFQITKDSLQWQLKPWTETEQNILHHHLKVIKNPLEDLSIDDNLTEILLPNDALNYKTLTIIPDKPIYILPFETLVHNMAYLVQTHALRYSSHLRFAYIQGKQISKQEDPIVSIFAPEYPKDDVPQYATRSVPYYLEGAQQEAKAIGKLFPSEAFIGKDATKAQFIANRSKGSILHMAMHATIDKENPEFSHFNFPNDEQLHIEELYALKIPADLAVLSACNTGVGKIESASGMASLQRALNFAGTKATVASLWEVPDQTTSKIMISFYEHLKKGYSKSEALHASKIEFLEDTKNVDLKHPYYWAGFVLYGDDTPVLNVSKGFWWYVFGALLVLAMVVFYYKR